MKISTLFSRHKPDVQDNDHTALSSHTSVITNQKRIFRADVPYLLQKNDQEIDRLDFQQYAFRQQFRTNYFAPILPTAKEILDIGSGTGKWVYEMGEEFPHGRIIGIDIDPPTKQPVTPQANCLFAQADILRGLPFPSNSFDLTHQRLLVGAIPAARWPFAISEMIRVTVPGGWVESFEGGSIYRNIGPATEQLLEWWSIAAPKVGFDLSFIPHLDDLFRQYGLSHVQLQVHPLPLGKWGGRVGDLLATDLESVTANLKPFYQRYAHVSPKRFDDLLKQLRHDWESNHTSYEFYSIIGQKPVASGVA